MPTRLGSGRGPATRATASRAAAGWPVWVCSMLSLSSTRRAVARSPQQFGEGQGPGVHAVRPRGSGPRRRGSSRSLRRVRRGRRAGRCPRRADAAGSADSSGDVVQQCRVRRARAARRAVPGVERHQALDRPQREAGREALAVVAVLGGAVGRRLRHEAILSAARTARPWVRAVNAGRDLGQPLHLVAEVVVRRRARECRTRRPARPAPRAGRLRTARTWSASPSGEVGSSGRPRERATREKSASESEVRSISCPSRISMTRR